MATDDCQRLFSTLTTDNFQRSFFVSDGNALTFNAYVVGRKYQRTTINILLAISGSSQRFKIEGWLVVVNFQRTTFNFQPSTDNF
jgi:hypothetical protein